MIDYVRSAHTLWMEKGKTNDQCLKILSPYPNFLDILLTLQMKSYMMLSVHILSKNKFQEI